MTTVFLGIFGFILMLGLLILIHELGHFLAAKMFGVKVEVFSIGFVGSIFSFKWGETQYKLGWLPLGGYVKMLGEADNSVQDPQLQKRAFSHKPIWQRAIIVMAGPFANLVVLPVLVLGGMFFTLQQDLSSTVGTVLSGRPAAKVGILPGDKIIAINGKPIRFFRELREVVEHLPGKPSTVTVLRGKEKKTIKITPFAYTSKDLLGRNKQRGLLGITAGFRTSQIGIKDPKSPAYQAGLRTFDVITSINGKAVKRWDQVEKERAKNPKGPHTYTVKRRLLIRHPHLAWTSFDKPKQIVVTPRMVPNTKGKTTYYDGIESSEGFVTYVYKGTPMEKTGLRPGDRLVRVGKQEIRTASDLTTLPQTKNQSYDVVYVRNGKTQKASFKLTPTVWVDPFKQRHQRIILGVRLSQPYSNGEMADIENRWNYSLNRAFKETWRFTKLIVQSIQMIFTREISSNSIGGPIMIFQIAQEAVKSGWEVFLQQMVLISINLGLINLLPIPILDGGHLVFLGIEGAIRRPVSAKIKYYALLVGFGFLLFLMLFAIRNDLQRLLSP